MWLEEQTIGHQISFCAHCLLVADVVVFEEGGKEAKVNCPLQVSKR